MEPQTVTQPTSTPSRKGVKKFGLWLGLLIIIILGVVVIRFNKAHNEAATPLQTVNKK